MTVISHVEVGLKSPTDGFWLVNVPNTWPVSEPWYLYLKHFWACFPPVLLSKWVTSSMAAEAVEPVFAHSQLKSGSYKKHQLSIDQVTLRQSTVAVRILFLSVDDFRRKNTSSSWGIGWHRRLFRQSLHHSGIFGLRMIMDFWIMDDYWIYNPI